MSSLNANTNNRVREGDIVFDCPYCGQSLAIAPEGAGLMVLCTGCGKEVQVPIVETAEGNIPQSGQVFRLEKTNTPEETIAQLDAALELANRQISQLLAEKESLLERRSYLEHLRMEHQRCFDCMAEELALIQGSLDRFSMQLQEARAGRSSNHMK